ncbi:hypothetical protein D6079_25085, partial [Vibrio parahaemolyticus]|nr:hypothetical protein [Vibrio parahaemolyticus]
MRSVTGKFSLYIFQFISLAIYARIFTPKEFGIVASIQVFVIFFQLLSDVGFGPAIINEDDFSEKKRNGVFSFTLFFGVILAFVFYSLSPSISYFYNGYDYTDISLVISLSIFFSSLSIVPLASLNKDAQFISIAKVDISSELTALFIILILHGNGTGVIALASRSAIQSCSRFILLWYFSYNTSIGRPKFGKEFWYVMSIASFSSYQLAFNVINYFSRNLDNLLVGKYMGMVPLGIYEKSYQLMRYPLLITSFALTPAIQPILMKKRADVDYVVKEHNFLAKRLIALSSIIAVFIYTNSDSIVLLLFGEQWYTVSPIVKIFAISIPFQAVLCTSGAFYQVMNKPRLLFVSGFIAAIINVSFITYGVLSDSLIKLSISVTCSYCINFIIGYGILFRFCFKSKVSNFYLELLSGIRTILMPCLIYCLCFYLLSKDIDINLYVDFVFNITLGLVILFCFRN